MFGLVWISCYVSLPILQCDKKCDKQTNIQTTALHLLLTVGLHDIGDADDRSLDVENLDHLLINRSHHHRVVIQQAADGSHGDGPIEQSAAYEHAATGENFFLLEAHFDETFMPVGLIVIGLREILDLTVDPEDATYGFHALQTCRVMIKGMWACESSGINYI